MKPPYLSIGIVTVFTVGGIVPESTAQLQPRTPLSKLTVISKPSFDSQLSLKFRDDHHARQVRLSNAAVLCGSRFDLIDARLWKLYGLRERK